MRPGLIVHCDAAIAGARRVTRESDTARGRDDRIHLQIRVRQGRTRADVRSPQKVDDVRDLISGKRFDPLLLSDQELQIPLHLGAHGLDGEHESGSADQPASLLVTAHVLCELGQSRQQVVIARPWISESAALFSTLRCTTKPMPGA